MVPVVPRPATKCVISGQSRRISGPVVWKWTAGFAGFAYWYRNTHSGWSTARLLARRTAPLEPSAPGESMISAPNTSSSWRRSTDTLSGSTTLSE